MARSDRDRGLDQDLCREQAESIFRAALDRVDPATMVGKALRIESAGGKRELVAFTEFEEARYDLSRFDRIMVTGMGKASARMAIGLEESLGALITGGLIVVKDGCSEQLNRIDVIEASHPVPDARSMKAARDILSLGLCATERTLFIVLVSGGGSALLCAPAEGLDLEDKARTTSLLLACGAAIQEVNCVRKHLSAVKGGRLAAALAPATVLSLILSDVVGDDLDAIASGPTVPDRTTWEDALGIATRRGILDKLPARVSALFQRGVTGESPDTPKPADPAFARVRNLVIGSNRLALMAAEHRARELGFNSLILTARLTGEARDAAGFILGIGEDIAVSGFPLQRPACLILGGETTVTLQGDGRGGRNQEMALAFLIAMGRNPTASERLFFLAASTDGSDGPTDAAGAYASARLLLEAQERGIDPREYLSRSDSFAFHMRLGSLLKTGATKTNVCDLQILLVP